LSLRPKRKGIRLASIRMVMCIPFIGCLNTDFGRVRPSLRTDDMHRWLGPAVTQQYGQVASQFPLTDDERMLRDLAYPLIEPAYDRQRWYSVLNEYGLSGVFHPQNWVYDPGAYAEAMFARHTRSTETYYARLIDDVRNDIDRIGPFAVVARRVSDMDMRRDKSLRYVSNMTPAEHANAVARMSENALIARWVHQSLIERAQAYRFALERLVVTAPSRQAAEVERLLNLMAIRIAEASLVPRGAPPNVLVSK
jgi:hypothetical protein